MPYTKCIYCDNEVIDDDVCPACLAYDHKLQDSLDGDAHEARCEQYRFDCLTNDPSV